MAREASPDSNKEGSTGGWQTAGADHVRKQSRAANANAPQLGQSGGPQQGHDGRVRAFVKNVTEEVDAEQLKSALSKFGEVVYFDVARVKVRFSSLFFSSHEVLCYYTCGGSGWRTRRREGREGNDAFSLLLLAA